MDVALRGSMMIPKPGDTVGYAKYFLRTIKTPSTDDTWFRRGTIVGTGGGLYPEYTHWRTRQPIVLPPEFVLVRWHGAIYPNEDGHNASLVRTSAIACAGSGRFAEDIS